MLVRLIEETAPLTKAMLELKRYGASEYVRGFEDGLKVAEKVLGWLTRQPDTKWQQEVRGWAEKEIKRARAEIMREVAEVFGM